MPRKGHIGRKQRWKKNCDTLLKCLEQAASVSKDWVQAVEDLREMQGEYQARLDSLPPNLRNSELAKKLRTIVDFPMSNLIINHEAILGELREMLDAVQNTPLPDAFKRNERGGS